MNFGAYNADRFRINNAVCNLDNVSEDYSHTYIVSIGSCHLQRNNVRQSLYINIYVACGINI